MNYRAKDFVQTAQGLWFAVVADGQEQGKVLCFLRYAEQNGRPQKLNTEQANAWLSAQYPHYLHHSIRLDADLHAVPQAEIVRHFQPRAALQHLLLTTSADPVVQDLQGLCVQLAAHHLDMTQFGITGSLLVGMQNHASDIDLVCYDRETFQQARLVIQALIAQNRCQPLQTADWLEAYQRRGCDFAFDDYLWHETRKYNKALFNQRKFDLSLSIPMAVASNRYQKRGRVKIQAKVIDDHLGFDYPALFVIDHSDIQQVVCFTATYSGQAKVGESIEISGLLESDSQGGQRVIVGSDREAIGEYIRVLR